MEENKEVKIAIVVGALMLTICLIVFIVHSSNNRRNNDIDIKIYKHYDTTGVNQGEYRECMISTEDALDIYTEFNKAKLLGDTDKITGQIITGTYKVVNGENNYIAFDANSSFIYRSDTNALYSFNSTIYDKVTSLCN